VGESDTSNRVKREEVGIQAARVAPLARVRGRRNSLASYESGGMNEMGQQVAKGTRHLRGRSTPSPTSIGHPGTKYRTNDNAQHVQNVSIPTFRTEGDISTEFLNPYETQEGHGGGGYYSGRDGRHLFVIARDHVDNNSHKGSRRNDSRDHDNVGAFNQHPIHVRRIPKRIKHVIAVDKAECHSNRMIRAEPRQDTCGNRDEPSKVCDGDVVTHSVNQTSELQKAA